MQMYWSDPAWVQAIGSVLAIIVAIVIASWQYYAQANRQEADRKEVKAAVKALARQGYLIAREAEAAAREAVEIQAQIDQAIDPAVVNWKQGAKVAMAEEIVRAATRLAAVNASLSAVNVNALPDARLVQDLTLFCGELQTTCKTLQAAVARAERFRVGAELADAVAKTVERVRDLSFKIAED